MPQALEMQPPQALEMQPPQALEMQPQVDKCGAPRQVSLLFGMLLPAHPAAGAMLTCIAAALWAHADMHC
jgi:hypothetical protein